MGYIYKIVNDVNNKPYIGKTKRTLEERYKEHLKASKYQTVNNHLYCAMRKYGCEHFHIELVEEVDDTQLNNREIYWISYYDSHNNGYNETDGGDGGKTMPTDKHRAMLGNKILQYDLDGNFIHEYVSSGEAASVTHTRQCEINRCTNRARNAYSANGFIWKRCDDDTPISVWVELNKTKFGRHAVLQFDLNGNLINKYESIAEANRKCGFSPNSRQITMCCSGRNKTAYGYIWEYNDSI